MLTRALSVVSALSVALALAWSAGARHLQPPDQNPTPSPRSDDRGGPRGGFRAGPGRRAGRGGEFRLGGGLERAVDDLKLSDNKKEQALAAVKTYQANVRQLTDLARSDLLLKMKEVLSEQEFKQFKGDLDRPAGFADVRGRRGAGFGGDRGLTVDQMVERILSFDKNKDGKITKDELPERMQNLIAHGDTNKDGALDADEVKKLANDLARNGAFRGRGNRGGPGAGFPIHATIHATSMPGLAGGFPAGSGIERALIDLKLSDKKKDTAETAVKAHQEQRPQTDGPRPCRSAPEDDGDPQRRSAQDLQGGLGSSGRLRGSVQRTDGQFPGVPPSVPGQLVLPDRAIWKSGSINCRRT